MACHEERFFNALDKDNKMKDKDQEFRQLISGELPVLRGGIYRIVGNATDTDDVVQDAMLRAYRQFGTFKNQASLCTWIYRIAVNCAFDFVRQKKRQLKMMTDYGENALNETAQAHDEEQLQALEEAVADLPENYREAIVWGCLSDLSGHDAAVKLGCSENTLYQRVFQAKQMLKKALMKEDEE